MRGSNATDSSSSRWWGVRAVSNQRALAEEASVRWLLVGQRLDPRGVEESTTVNDLGLDPRVTANEEIDAIDDPVTALGSFP